LCGHILFLEGEHDVIFLRHALKDLCGITVIEAKTGEANGKIRRLREGVLLIDCGGVPGIYNVPTRLVRQIISTAEIRCMGHELLLVGDSDRVSAGKLAQTIEGYLRTPCKTHTLNFEVQLEGSDIGIHEKTKNLALNLQVHAVPNSLEDQILRRAASQHRITFPSGAVIEDRLAYVAGLLRHGDVNQLLKDSVSWFEQENWLQQILAKTCGQAGVNYALQ